MLIRYDTWEQLQARLVICPLQLYAEFKSAVECLGELIRGFKTLEEAHGILHGPLIVANFQGIADCVYEEQLH